jgi:hypothetical protein
MSSFPATSGLPSAARAERVKDALLPLAPSPETPLFSPSTSPYTDFSRSFSNSSSSSASHSQAPTPYRSRSETVTAADEEIVQFSSRDSALLSPRLSQSQMPNSSTPLPSQQQQQQQQQQYVPSRPQSPQQRSSSTAS